MHQSKRVKRWTFIVFFFSGAGLSAQNQIGGRIADKDDQPLAYANVVLFNSPDSTFVKGEVAGIDGRFAINGLVPGAYYCQVSMVGLSAKRTPVFELKNQVGGAWPSYSSFLPIRFLSRAGGTSPQRQEG